MKTKIKMPKKLRDALAKIRLVYHIWDSKDTSKNTYSTHLWGGAREGASRIWQLDNYEKRFKKELEEQGIKVIKLTAHEDRSKSCSCNWDNVDGSKKEISVHAGRGYLSVVTFDLVVDTQGLE